MPESRAQFLALLQAPGVRLQLSFGAGAHGVFGEPGVSLCASVSLLLTVPLLWGCAGEAPSHGAQ